MLESTVPPETVRVAFTVLVPDKAHETAVTSVPLEQDNFDGSVTSSGNVNVMESVLKTGREAVTWTR